MRLNTLVLATLIAPATLAAQGIPRRAMTFEDFAAVRAVADPQLSPDGRTVLYTVRTNDVDANRQTARTFAVPATGGEAREFPTADAKVTEARWSPDGRRVAYVAGGQLWVSDADGANKRHREPRAAGAGCAQLLGSGMACAASDGASRRQATAT